LAGLRARLEESDGERHRAPTLFETRRRLKGSEPGRWGGTEKDDDRVNTEFEKTADEVLRVTAA
jgi:hypothetical protein